MRNEPETKKAVIFIDGQNLYRCAKDTFGHNYPNYDVKKIAERICIDQGWQLAQIRFYTGIPDRTDNSYWHNFWSAKLAHLGRTGIHTFSRSLRYRNKTVELPDGSSHSFLVGEEKGIDVRIALDVIRLAHRGDYDVAVIFSQDQDLSEASDEVKVISQEQDRWIQVVSAFPNSPTSSNTRGINGTQWIKIDRTTYDACLDPRDYRSSTA